MNLKSDDFFSELDIVVIQFSIQDSILDHKYCSTIFCDILNILKKLDAHQLEEIKIRLDHEYEDDKFHHEIAKYYVKLLNLLSTIVRTINPRTSACDRFILESESIYYDVYDPSQDKFTSISKTNRINYANDLNFFYKSFAGKEDPPSKFGDISLLDCSLNGFSNTRISMTSSIQELVLKKYSDAIKSMVDNINKNKLELVTVFNEILNIDSDLLTSTVLNNYIVDTKSILIKMYAEYNKDKKNIENCFKTYDEIYEIKKLEYLR